MNTRNLFIIGRREVATIVNKDQVVARYEVKFDAGNLASEFIFTKSSQGISLYLRK